ncbi:hypothetical protein MTOK_48380 [Mycolicibacterium tokaiense]|nr:hypothetical protein MTOK_48380 [Mycolicibacterium tokaiense]
MRRRRTGAASYDQQCPTIEPPSEGTRILDETAAAVAAAGQNTAVVPGFDQEALRSAALEWVRRQTLDGTRPITRDELANDFVVGGERFPLIDRGAGSESPRGGTRHCQSPPHTPRRGSRHTTTEKDPMACTGTSSDGISGAAPKTKDFESL